MAIEREIIITANADKAIKASQDLNKSLTEVKKTNETINKEAKQNDDLEKNLKAQTKATTDYNAALKQTSTIQNAFKSNAAQTNSVIASGAKSITASTSLMASNSSILNSTISSLTGGLSMLVGAGLSKVNNAMPESIQNLGWFNDAANAATVGITAFGAKTGIATKASVDSLNKLQTKIPEIAQNKIRLEELLETIARIKKELAEFGDVDINPIVDKADRDRYIKLSADLKSANNELSEVNKKQAEFLSSFKSAVGGLGAETASSVSKIALSFGAVGVAIAAATAAVVVFFTSTLKGSDQLEVAGARISSFWDKIKNKVASSGESIWEFLTQGEPVKGGIVEYYRKVTDSAAKLRKDQIAYRRAKIKDDYDDANTEIKIAKLKEEATDKTNKLTSQQRLDKYKEAKALTKGLLEDDVNWAKQEFALYTRELEVMYGATITRAKGQLILLKNNLGTAGEEQLKKFYELSGNIRKAQEASSEGLLSFNKRIKEGFALESPTGGKDPLAELKANYKAALEEIANMGLDETQMAKKREEEISKINEQALANRLINEQQYLKNKNNLEVKYKDVYRKIEEQKAIQAQQNREQALSGTSNLLKDQSELLNKAADEEAIRLAKAYQDKIISQQEFNAAMLALDIDYINKRNIIRYGDRQDLIDKEAGERKLAILNQINEAGYENIFDWSQKAAIADVEAKQQSLQNDIETTQQQISNATNLRLTTSANSEERKQADADLLAAQIANAEVRKALDELDAQRQKDQVSNVIGMFDAFAQAAEENTVAVKGAKSASVAVDTYQSAFAADAGMIQAFPGPVGFVLGKVAAVAQVLKGAQAIKKIWAVNKDTKSPTPTTVAPPSIQAVRQVNTDTEVKLNQQASKVYVVESDITNAQNKVKVTQSEASF